MSGGFEDLGLLPELVRATQELGWLLPSDVQDESIPLMLGGGDVMVAAETGSGKTGAFALPTLQLVHEIRRRAEGGGEGAAGGGGGGEREVSAAVLNVEDRSASISVSADGLRCQSRQEHAWGGVRGSVGARRGKVYFEATIEDEGLARVGWAARSATFDLGTDAFGWGFGGTGRKSHQRRFDEYGESFGKGDVLGCLLEVGGDVGLRVEWSKNGVLLGEAFRGKSPPGPLFPAVCLKNAQVSLNFGSSPWKHAPPAGYVGLSGARGAAGVVLEEAGADSDALGDGVLAVVIAPARDLAEQIFSQFQELSRFVRAPRLKCALVIGGVDVKKTKASVKGADVVVGTPGKIIDLSSSGALDLSTVRILVLDEADRLCDADGLEMVEKIWTKIPKKAKGGERLQVGFFSATLHGPHIAKLSDTLCHHPTWVDLKGKDSVPETVHHVIIPVDPATDLSWTRGAICAVDQVHARDSIRKTHPKKTAKDGSGKGKGGAKGGGGGGGGASGASASASASAAASASAPSTPGSPPHGWTKEELSEGVKRLKPRMLVALLELLGKEQVLIFCRTNLDCDHLEDFLVSLGGGRGFKGDMNPFSCAVLAGSRPMPERRKNLAAFQNGEVRCLICTDVAARGIDISGLPYVVNVTLPHEAEDYIHRVGRVGRADRMGLAISLVSTVPEKVWYFKGKLAKGSIPKDPKGKTIWFEEQAVLDAVQKRLHIAPPEGPGIPQMKLEVHPDATEAAKAYSFTFPEGIGVGVAYGAEKGATEGPSEHVVAIRPAVESLTLLEEEAQNLFWGLKMNKF